MLDELKLYLEKQVFSKIKYTYTKEVCIVYKTNKAQRLLAFLFYLNLNLWEELLYSLYTNGDRSVGFHSE